MIEINSNGSKWQGEAPDSIETLLDVLNRYPLDRVFENYGNFYQAQPKWLRNPETGKRHYEEYPNAALFFGNFYNYSHVFNIVTDEPEVIERLASAIRANQQREDYRSQPVPVQKSDKPA